MASKKILILLMTNVILIFFLVSNGVSAEAIISHVSISSSKSIISQQGDFSSQTINDSWKVDWEQTFGEFDDGAYSVITTADGGYLITGDTWSYGASAGDIFLLKMDSSGRVEWNQTYGGNNHEGAKSIITTTDGGYALAGLTYSYGAGSSDMWLLKIDENGSMLWEQTFGGAEGEGAETVIATIDGGYAVVGYTWSFSAGSFDMWLVKTNSTGHEEWNQTFGGSNSDWAQSVISTVDGGYALAGYTESYGAGEEDMWLVKTNSTGHEEWNQTFGGQFHDEIRSIITTGDGGYILAGFTSSYGAGLFDIWLVKTNSTGYMEWNQTIGGDSNEITDDFIPTTDGGYVLVGYTSSYGAGGRDMLIVKTDTNGAVEWVQIFGGIDSDWASSVVITPDGGYLLVGTTSSYGNGDHATWIVKTTFREPFLINTIFNIPIELLFPYLLISCSLIGSGLITINITKKRKFNKTQMSTKDISDAQIDSLYKNMASEIHTRPRGKDQTTISNVIAEERAFSTKDFLFNMDNTNTLLSDSSLTTKSDYRTPLLVILISPLFWIVSNILFLPQLRKLTMEKVENNPLRVEIIAILRFREFEHYNALKQQLNCGNSILTWHLQVLEDFGLIKRKRFGRVQVFFLKTSFIDEYKLKIYCSIRNKTALKILKSFLDKKSRTVDLNLMTKELAISRKLIKYHCNKFVSLGLFEKIDNKSEFQLVKTKRHYINWLIERYRLAKYTV